MTDTKILNKCFLYRFDLNEIVISYLEARIYYLRKNTLGRFNNFEFEFIYYLKICWYCKYFLIVINNLFKIEFLFIT